MHHADVCNLRVVPACSCATTMRCDRQLKISSYLGCPPPRARESEKNSICTTCALHDHDVIPPCAGTSSHRASGNFLINLQAICRHPLSHVSLVQSGEVINCGCSALWAAKNRKTDRNRSPERTHERNQTQEVVAAMQKKASYQCAAKGQRC